MHSFCASCLSAWVDVSALCPLCKSKPDQIHWGADTALGVLNTITVTSSLPFYANRPDRWRDRREAAAAGGLTWREALRNVAVQARKDEVKQEQLDLASTEGDLQEGGAALDDRSASTTGGASENAAATATKRGHGHIRGPALDLDLDPGRLRPSTATLTTLTRSSPHM
ncbi:hypothetical protein K457DRAFT_535086 [Linnemannia elongata AG-77]|uniref:RING-type domain-containing protein n=1 Tax=Linnemannia elongata AG-77 TaxID=1314771 RepID=A0A197JVM9_9FUNG|nr:hypothetical protein K457DRAFT_535086 [Linnemannia elongata AG-77]